MVCILLPATYDKLKISKSRTYRTGIWKVACLVIKRPLICFEVKYCVKDDVCFFKCCIQLFSGFWNYERIIRERGELGGGWNILKLLCTENSDCSFHFPHLPKLWTFFCILSSRREKKLVHAYVATKWFCRYPKRKMTCVRASIVGQNVSAHQKHFYFPVYHTHGST